MLFNDDISTAERRIGQVDFEEWLKG